MMKGMSNGSQCPHFPLPLYPFIDYDPTDQDPLRAIQLIDSLSLHRSIFSPPPSTSASIPVPDSISHHTALAAATILHRFMSLSSSSHDHSPVPPLVENSPTSDASQEAVTESRRAACLYAHPSPLYAQLPAPHPTLLSHVLTNSSTRRRLFLASALTPYRRLTYQEKKKTKLLVEACIREGLKVTSTQVNLWYPPIMSLMFHSIVRGPKPLCRWHPSAVRCFRSSLSTKLRQVRDSVPPCRTRCVQSQISLTV
jgi:hypothetical protein